MAEQPKTQAEAQVITDNRMQMSYAASQDNLSFPSDMSYKFYPECIKFTILKRGGADMETAINKGIDAGKAKQKELAGFSNDQVLQDKLSNLEKEKDKLGLVSLPTKKQLEEIKAIDAKISTLQGGRISGIGDTGNILAAGFVAAGSELKAGYATVKPKYSSTSAAIISTMYLNMPDALPAYADKIEWQGSDMGALLGGIASGGIDVSAGIFNQSGNIAAGGIGAVVGKLFGGGGIGGGVLGMALGADKLQKFSEHGQGAIQNPYKEQTFNGIGFRSFQFSFTMKARSDGDINIIRNIVDNFRAFARPSFKDVGNASTFKYPHEFHVEFLKLSDGQDGNYTINENIPAIKYCICDSVTTSFSEGAWKAHQGGAPLTVKLDISLQETELVTQDDILGLGMVGRFAETGRKF